MLDLDPATIQSIDAAEEVRSALVEKIRAVTHAERPSRVVRVAVSVPERVLPVDWIRAQQSPQAIYWSGRDDARTVATIGAADVLDHSAAPIDYSLLERCLHKRLADRPASVRYYGGLRFDAPQADSTTRPDRRWHSFGTYRFVLPRFELVEADDALTLACNLVLPRDAERTEALVEDVYRLALPRPEAPAPLPEPLRRTDVPDKETWTRMVRWALDAIEEEALDKVVLARRMELELGAPMDPLLVLRHLEAATPGCFHFALRPPSGPAFVGASPERLLRREQRDVVSEAVAGTRPRGDTAEEDAVLRKKLLQSPKERREHAFVQDAIQSDLECVCSSVEAPGKTSDLALARGRHLHASLEGILAPDTSTVDLLRVLHPTPAVAGVPTPEAIAAIRAQEPFDRGWYAGPVGWIGSEAAEFAVALRAGLVDESQLALFSGAGIVEGSMPDREWDEIEQKIGDFAAILGLDGRDGSLA